ncbi:hypothetical protein Tco_0760760, partial [Tanacetum coccineum]
TSTTKLLLLEDCCLDKWDTFINMDKSWMGTNWSNKSYVDAVAAFIDFAVHNLQKMGNKSYVDAVAGLVLLALAGVLAVLKMLVLLGLAAPSFITKGKSVMEDLTTTMRPGINRCEITISSRTRGKLTDHLEIPSGEIIG